jgi:uncharacterized membrane protein
MYHSAWFVETNTNIDSRDRCTDCVEHTISSEIISVHLEIVLILIQDRCTVCAERTVSLEIILDTPEGTPR